MSRELVQVPFLSTYVVKLAEDIIKKITPESFDRTPKFWKPGQQASHIIRMTGVYCLNDL